MKFTRGPGRVASLRKSSSFFVLVTAFVALLLYYVFRSRTRYEPTLETFDSSNHETIYCVMITKDSRIKYALHAVDNFFRQDYKNTRLILISETKIEDAALKDDRVLQVPLQRDGDNPPTLGKLRNIAFEFIPDGALWTVWDDDDIRSNGYLTSMRRYLGNNDYAFITKRIEYNMNTGFSWVMKLTTGFVLFFGRKSTKLRYEDVDVNEDVSMRDAIKRSSLKSVLVDNDPRMYIRTVHDDNTSVLVDKGKTKIKDTRANKMYFESEIKTEELEYAREKIAILNTFLNRR